MIRKEEKDDEQFQKALKNPLKPINDTTASPEMEKYIQDMNDGKFTKEKKKELSDDEKRLAEKEKRQKMVCPKCHRGELKKTPSGVYACGFCGMTSNSPAYIIDPEG